MKIIVYKGIEIQYYTIPTVGKVFSVPKVSSFIYTSLDDVLDMLDKR